MIFFSGPIPKHISWAMHSNATVHYEQGSSYPIGGCSEFPFHLIPAIEEAGGKVLVRAQVSKLLTNSNTVVGKNIDVFLASLLCVLP